MLQRNKSLIVSPELFNRVQDNLHDHNRPKQRKHEFAFAGLLDGAYDDCMITAEMKKQALARQVLQGLEKRTILLVRIPKHHGEAVLAEKLPSGKMAL